MRLITITNCKLLWSLPLLAFISILLQLLENSKSASLQDQMTNYHLENHSWSNNCISCSVEVVPYGTLIYQSNDITMGWNYFWHSILIIRLLRLQEKLLKRKYQIPIKISTLSEYSFKNGFTPLCNNILRVLKSTQWHSPNISWKTTWGR